ncbi:hypothetical protein [Paraprevotella xylaniphila]|uniref:hypothetical protein n=1 Tax=Paraprevotella xylaniphila TaxID=454155 RepID=UPI001E42B8CA|nr:hypothetical protein [Paraprevotella xylaniphila]
MLKPKVKAFGFNKKELMGIAAKIADNLTSAEDALDEDVNAEVEERIDAVLPFLQVSQSYANRLAEDARRKNDDDETDDEDDNNEPQKNNRQPGSNKNNSQNNEKNDDAPAWAKGLLDKVDSLTNEISVLKGEKVATSRKSKLNELLKNSGSFGSRILKSFDRMKFETDEEFEEFYSEVEEDLKNYNQERADAGLATLANPPAAGGKGSGKQDEPFSDAEIDALADL